MARRKATLVAGAALLIIAALCVVGCRAAFPVAMDQATAPGLIRGSMYQTHNIPGSPKTTSYSGIKWFGCEARDGNWLVASTATEFSTSGSGSGASSSTLLWTVSLWPSSSSVPTEGRALATLTGPLAGPGTRPADFQAKSGSSLLHEGGTGWLEFRALDQEGKVIYTIE